MANSKLYRYNEIIAGEELCLHLLCSKLYTLQKGDLCVSIEMAQNLKLGDVRHYNPWLNLDCPNFHVATPVLANVLCLGPESANVTTIALLPSGPTAVPAPGDGYRDAPVGPPKGVAVAGGTTLRCGRGFVVADAAQTFTSMCPKWHYVEAVFGGQSVPQRSRLLGLVQDGQEVLCRTRPAMAV